MLLLSNRVVTYFRPWYKCKMACSQQNFLLLTLGLKPTLMAPQAANRKHSREKHEGGKHVPQNDPPSPAVQTPEAKGGAAEASSTPKVLSSKVTSMKVRTDYAPATLHHSVANGAHRDILAVIFCGKLS